MATSSSERECTLCGEALSKYRSQDGISYIFTVDIDVVKIKGKLKENKDKRDKLKEIEKTVSALRNTAKGVVLIHLINQDIDDKYLGHFDDFTDDALKRLIPDGRPFTETYSRKWLSEVIPCEGFSNFVVLEVQKSDYLATVDFKTKVPTEFKVESPSTLTIVSILSSLGDSERRSAPVIRGIEDYQHRLHESRNIELKYLSNEKQKLIDKSHFTCDDFVHLLWNELRFKDNLCSLSKLETGGSYFVGIQEKARSKKPYESKELCLTGFRFTLDKRDFVKSLHEKVDTETSINLRTGRLGKVPRDILKVEFHKHPIKSDFYILEIAVGFINGIVFYSKKGPATYFVNSDQKVCRMEHKDWLQRIRNNPFYSQQRV